MDTLHFIDLTASTVIILFLVGFVGGMVSGFIGSGGAFVLTPAMMSLGVPGIVAVASNMAHKFPKALVGAIKRHKYGQVDVKLGVIMGIFAEAGVLVGKHIMTDIRDNYGAVGTDLYVSFVFVVVLAIVGGYVLRDGLRERAGRHAETDTRELGALARWARTLHIPGTMMYFKSMDARVSILVVAPLGFATGLLAASIAVGGFIGVPAMMYILGVPALTASATELVIAFVMGTGGSFFYAWEGFVDIRLAMIILAGSLFGIQIGAIGTTYVKDYVVKFVMAVIMLTVLVSRFFYIPGYLSELNLITPLAPETLSLLKTLGEATLAFALLFGAGMIIKALFSGMREHRLAMAESLALAGAGAPAMGFVAEPPPAPAAGTASAAQRSPLGRFERFLVASDGSEFSAAAVREAIRMAGKCGAELHVMSMVTSGEEHEALAGSIVKQEMERAQAHLDTIRGQAVATGVRCRTHLVQGNVVDRNIIGLADEVKADVIVMGRRGRRGLAMAMLGHATARVIGQAGCHVLVVPRAAQVEGRHIVVGTDGSRFADHAATTAGKLAGLCGAPVTVVSVTSASHGPERRADATAAVEQVVARLNDSGVSAQGVVPHGRPDEMIVATAREQGADLIVTGSHGRTGLQRVLMGSVSERVINEASCAVLVVKG